MIKILVVEDDPNTRDGLIELLRDEGYQVAGAQLGLQAVKRVSDESCDIVLIDYSLPDIDGLEVCRMVRKQSDQIVLILITGYFNTEIMNAAREFKISKIFTKPLVLNDLFDKLCDCSNQLNLSKK